ncbi:hypothetical protein Dimus_007327 [Dionaea muscipula]
MGRKKKIVGSAGRDNAKASTMREGELVCLDGQCSAADRVEVEDNGVSGFAVSHFDCSIENHFSMMDTISKLCGQEVDDDFEEGDVDRFASNATFLSEWRHFSYKPRTIRFASCAGTNQENNKLDVIVLPQFSAAAVPQVRMMLVFWQLSCVMLN